MLPGFFLPSNTSFASFTFAAMKLLPPARGSQQAGVLLCSAGWDEDRYAEPRRLPLNIDDRNALLPSAPMTKQLIQRSQTMPPTTA